MVHDDVLETIIFSLKKSSYSISNCFILCCVNKTFLNEFYDKYKILCLNEWLKNHIFKFYMSNMIHSYKNFKKINENTFRINLVSRTNLKPIVGILKICDGKLSLKVSSGYKTKINENTESLHDYYRSNYFENIKSLNKLKFILSKEFFDECWFIPKSQHTYTTNVIKTNVMYCSTKVLRFGE